MTSDYALNDPERDVMAGAVQDAVSKMDGRDGEMVTEFVVIAVIYNKDGEKLLSAWTARDQRQWTSLGLIEFYKLDHQAYATERRLHDE